MSRSFLALAALLLALGGAHGARAASYQLLDGSIVSNIEVRYSNAVHPYAGPDLRSSASLVGASLADADLREADLRFALVSSADLSGALLTGVVLSSGELSGTDLSAAVLSGADISGTNLTVANLDGADLSGANLAAVIGLATTTGSAFYDDDTNFVGTGFDPVAAGWRRVHRIYDGLMADGTWYFDLLHGGPYVECTSGWFTVPGNRVGSQQAAGAGNPRSYRRFGHFGAAGCGPEEFSSSHVSTGYAWNPGVEGALASVTVRFDAAVTDCCESGAPIGDETAFGVVVQQGGVDYVSTTWTVHLGTGWNSLSFKRLKPQHLVAVNGAPGQVPDFSSAGGEIRFGFYAFHAKNGQTVSSTNAVDNFEVLPHRPDCANGWDDDGDGATDFVGGDPGCASSADSTEKDETGTFPCDDGADNDGDGRIDFDPATLADPLSGVGDLGCAGPDWRFEAPQCQDGLDNDGAPGTDFDGGASLGVSDPNGADPNCSGVPWRNRERKRKGCGLGFEMAPILAGIAFIRRRRRGLHQEPRGDAAGERAEVDRNAGLDR